MILLRLMQFVLCLTSLARGSKALGMLSVRFDMMDLQNNTNLIPIPMYQHPSTSLKVRLVQTTKENKDTGNFITRTYMHTLDFRMYIRVHFIYFGII